MIYRHLHRVTYIATEVRIPHHPDGQNFPWGALLKAMSSLRATAGLSRARTSATTITGALSYNNGRSVCGHEHARYNHVPQPAITRAPPPAGMDAAILQPWESYRRTWAQALSFYKKVHRR